MPNDRPPRAIPPKIPLAASPRPPAQPAAPPALPRPDVSPPSARPRVSISLKRVNSIVPPALAAGAAAPKVVLVADDDERARRLLVRALRMQYTVWEATSEDEAWRIMQRAASIDCAIVSRQLAGEGGLALAKRVRADARLRNLAVIFVTGAAQAAAVAEGIGVGVRYVLTKPLKVKEVVDLVAASVPRG